MSMFNVFQERADVTNKEKETSKQPSIYERELIGVQMWKTIFEIKKVTEGQKEQIRVC